MQLILKILICNTQKIYEKVKTFFKLRKHFGTGIVFQILNILQERNKRIKF